MKTRREFLTSVSAMAAAKFLKLAEQPLLKSYGIAYTSFPIRIRQGREMAGNQGHPLPAEKFIDLCHSFGGSGCQMDVAQLTSAEPEYLKRIRAQLEAKEMFMEFAVSARTLENADAFAKVAASAHQLGVSRLRIACLSGRRYEDFHEMSKWQDFANHWKRTFKQAEPMLKQHKLLVGIENHKDWLADEFVEMLKSVSSPYLGTCVDFGNNLALLEDSVEVAKKLAPYVVTTHLKDMAVKLYPDGFELSEVALGDGITPLAEIIGIIRKQRSDVHFCLEMITRDPLKVPYKTDHYWITYERRDEARIKKFESTVLRRASKEPLPRITGLKPQEALAFEDDNLRRSGAYAKQVLKS
ncbi:MAG: sugar phosphate isomerase/epimerase [Acidobacteria bacterium]|nr:sugar phosphate isomerase/epimerase [Acidobacteriota bacterium]